MTFFYGVTAPKLSKLVRITTNDPHALEGFHAHAEVIGLEQYMLQGYIKANSRLHSRTTAVVAEIMI